MNETNFRDYAAAWEDKMVEIWRDRLDLLVYSKDRGYRQRTGALRQSVRATGNTVSAEGTGEIEFQFLMYGVYVDVGTGRGYARGNDGKQEKLRGQYGGRSRERTLWYSRSLAISRRVYADALYHQVGQAAVMAVRRALE